MKFNRETFFSEIKPIIGTTSGLLQSQVDGVNSLLDFIEGDGRWGMVEHLAYYLATVSHETGRVEIRDGKKLFVRTMQPIYEVGDESYFDKYDGRRDLGNVVKGDGFTFRGAGYVQDTGRKNARKLGEKLSGRTFTNPKTGEVFMVNATTFTRNPELRLVPEVSYESSVDGLMTGRYTGVPITRYIYTTKEGKKNVDYFNSRRVINGLDKAETIEMLAVKFERAIRKSLLDESAISTPESPISTSAAKPSGDTAFADKVTDSASAGVGSVPSVTSVLGRVFVKIGAGLTAVWGTTGGKIAIILTVLVVSYFLIRTIYANRVRIGKFTSAIESAIYRKLGMENDATSDKTGND